MSVVVGLASYSAYHFLAADKRLHPKLGRVTEVGCTYSFGSTEPIALGKRGIHASASVIDAVESAPSPLLCLLEVWGDVQHDSEELVGRHCKVLAMGDAERAIHNFSLATVEEELRRTNVNDPRLWDALSAKRLWLGGSVDDAALEKAFNLARDYQTELPSAEKDAHRVRSERWHAAEGTLAACLRNFRGLARVALAVARMSAAGVPVESVYDTFRATRYGISSALEAELQALLTPQKEKK